jgi:hypothetical protein
LLLEVHCQHVEQPVHTRLIQSHYAGVGHFLEVLSKG